MNTQEFSIKATGMSGRIWEIDSETRDSQFYSGCSVVAKNSDFVSVLGLGLKR